MERLTSLMKKVTEAYCPPGVNLRSLLEDLYTEQKLSARQIGEQLRVSQKGIKDQSISRWLKEFNIPRRTPLEGLAAYHQDSARVSEAMTRSHSAESQKNRTEAVQKFYRDHPELLIERGKTKRKNTEEHRQQVFGGEPKEVLEKMFNQDYLSLDKIADRLGYHPATINIFKNRFGIKVARKQIVHFEPQNTPSVEFVKLAEDLGFLEALPDVESQTLIERAGLYDKPKTLTEAANGGHRQTALQRQERGIARIQVLSQKILPIAELLQKF